ncbi:MAG: hypothetical protein ACKVU1_01000 [bacterium]
MRAALGATLLALAFAIGSGCGGGSGTPDPENPAEALTAEGWTLFESGNFTGAKSRFRDAIAASNTFADAHNGLGWSLAFLDSLDSAQRAFSSAITNAASGGEAHAGRAFVRAETDSDALALALADAATALTRAPLFVFSHDATIDWRDVRLLRAQLFFALGAIDSSAAEVDLLDGALPDASDPGFADSLAAEIERIGAAAAPPAL